MSLYKTIELPNFEVVRKTIYDILQTQQLSQTDGVYPFDAGIDMHSWMQRIRLLVEDLKSIGLHDGWVATSLVLTYKEIPIHMDHAQEFDYSLNLPILNTEGTFTCFYESLEPPETRWLPNGIPYDAYNPKKCKMIDKVEILEPTLLNVKVPHGVVLNNNPTPRITMALRMNHG
jgi:hypothetical protein